jgi:hypothetical protein
MTRGTFRGSPDIPMASHSIGQLHLTGWHPTEIGIGGGDGASIYVVGARNGEHAIHAEGPTLTLAWWRAAEMAAAYGTLAN